MEFVKVRGLHVFARAGLRAGAGLRIPRLHVPAVQHWKKANVYPSPPVLRGVLLVECGSASAFFDGKVLTLVCLTALGRYTHKG